MHVDDPPGQTITLLLMVLERTESSGERLETINTLTVDNKRKGMGIKEWILRNRQQ